MGLISGLFGLIVFGLDVWAIIEVGASRAGTTEKVIWIVLILVLPVLGFIAWLVAGPRGLRR